MPDLLRRGAVHVIVVALIVAALAPQALAATPPDHVTQQLLDAVEASPASLISARGSTSQRTLAAFAPASDSVPLGAERIHPNGVAVPPSVATSPTLVSVAAQVAAQVVSQPGGGRTISGKASWYCCTRGWDDAAVVALPIALGGHWTTPPAIFSVVVCAERCALLPVGDACACYWGEAGQKVVDLSPAAWAAITDKDRWVYGVVNVTVYLD
ncbi:MAG TPA: hypothetical protein VMK30_00530 [Pleomorphomonadaceae bacterium]|nr:hypothetical protein [Pleomorphomonadaceae bacterium]